MRLEAARWSSYVHADNARGVRSMHHTHDPACTTMSQSASEFR